MSNKNSYTGKPAVIAIGIVLLLIGLVSSIKMVYRISVIIIGFILILIGFLGRE